MRCNCFWKIWYLQIIYQQSGFNEEIEIFFWRIIEKRFYSILSQLKMCFSAKQMWCARIESLPSHAVPESSGFCWLQLHRSIFSLGDLSWQMQTLMWWSWCWWWFSAIQTYCPSVQESVAFYRLKNCQERISGNVKIIIQQTIKKEILKDLIFFE